MATFLVVVRMQKSMEAHWSWVFPRQYFFERLRNPDQLDGTGDAFASRKLHEKKRLEFEAAFAGARGLSKGDYAKHGGSSQFPRPMKKLHGSIIAKHGATNEAPGGSPQRELFTISYSPLSAIASTSERYFAVRLLCFSL